MAKKNSEKLIKKTKLFSLESLKYLQDYKHFLSLAMLKKTVF